MKIGTGIHRCGGSLPPPLCREITDPLRPAESFGVRRGLVARSGAGSNRWRHSEEPPPLPDNRAAPAHDDRPARIRTRTNEVGARHAPVNTTGLDFRFPGASLSVRMRVGQCWVTGPLVGGRSAARGGGAAAAGQGSESGRPGSNGHPRSGAPMLFPMSYVRRCARLESNQRACRIRAVLSTELRGVQARFPDASQRTRRRVGQCLGHTARSLEGAQRREAAARPPPVREAREPPAGVEPALRPYKGRVLAVDTTEA